MQAWTRSELKELAFDYAERYETSGRITVEDDFRAPAIDGQRALVEMLGAPELAQEATWVEAGRSLTAWWLSVPTAKWRDGCEHAAHDLAAQWTALTRGSPSVARSPPKSIRSRKRRSWSSSASRGCHPSSRRGKYPAPKVASPRPGAIRLHERSENPANISPPIPRGIGCNKINHVPGSGHPDVKETTLLRKVL